jgi:ATP-dependent DNA ligase
MEIENLIDELRSTTSKIEKRETLSLYMNDHDDGEFIKDLLMEAFDPNILHHVLIKKVNMPMPGSHTLLDLESDVRKLFKELHEELSPTKNKERVWEIMERLSEESQLALIGIVNKRLQCGVSLKSLNKVEEDFIFVVPIPLAKSYKPESEHKYSSQLYSSYKLDGQRVFCIRDKFKWSKYSRAGDYLGNEIHTLGHWDEELEHYYEATGMNYIDSEAYLHGMTFEEITGLIKSSVNKKDATPLECHVLFVGRDKDVFEAARSNHMIGVPPNTICQVFKRYTKLVGVKQKSIPNDESVIYEEVDEAVSKGYEGICLRSSVTIVDFKRGNNLLKAKKSDLSGTIEEIDAYVVDMDYGEFSVREDGVETIEILPVALWITLSDSSLKMKVGSGFSLKQRRDWLDDETRIIAKTVELEYQGRGAKGRLRFPVFKRVRDDL